MEFKAFQSIKNPQGKGAGSSAGSSKTIRLYQSINRKEALYTG
jgi:hypothetical protein